MTRTKKFLLVISLLAPLSLVAQVTWDGGASDNLWSSAANWNPDGVPGDGDDVIINGDYTVSVTASDSCTSLQLISEDANGTSVHLIVTNGARLGIGQDVDVDDRDRTNCSAILDIEDGAVLYVAGDLFLTKNNGTSNNNDMLLRLFDDDSRLQVVGDIIADFSGNNNNTNDMGIRMTERSVVIADSIYIELGGSQEGNVLIEMNVGGADDDSASISIQRGMFIENDAGSMDCIIDQDYASSIEVGGSFQYGATAGEGFYWYIDRDARVLVSDDLSILKDGNEEVYIYLNENDAGTSSDALIDVGGDFELIKTDGDDCFLRLNASSMISTGGNFIVNTSNEDDGGDDVNLIMNDGSSIQVAQNLRFFLDDNSAVDLLIELNDSSSITTTSEMTVDFNNATLFELELNDEADVSVGTDFQFDNTASSNIPVLDMDNDASMSVGGDFNWNDNNTTSDNNAGFFLDRNAALTITGDLNVIKTVDGDFNLYLNQNADGDAGDAQISATNFVLDKDNGDDIDIRMGDGSGITLLNDWLMHADNQDGNNDDIIIDLTDDASVIIPGDFLVTLSDNNAVDFYMQLNDNAVVDIGDSMSVVLTNAALFEIELNDASLLDVGNDFFFENTNSSHIPVLDMDNTSRMLVGGDFVWNDNDTESGNTQGIFLDRDAELAVADSMIITVTEDGNFFFYLNQNDDGSAADAQVSASNLVVTKTGGDVLYFYLNDGSGISLTNDFIVSANDQDGNGDDIRLFMYDDAQIDVPGDLMISYSDNNAVDLYIQTNGNATIDVGDSFSVVQTDADYLELEMSDASAMTVGGDFSMRNTTNSLQPVIDMDNTSSLSIGEDLIWIDNSDANNASSGFFLDRDASLQVTDSIYVDKSTDGDFHFFLNQAADGAADDAQVSCNVLEVDADNLDQVFFRMSNDADIMVQGDVYIDANNSEADDHVELTMNDDAGFNIGGDFTTITNSVNAVDIDWNLATSDSLVVNGSVVIDKQDGDDIIIDVSDATTFFVGNDVTVSLANGDNLLIDVYDDAQVIVTDRLTATVSQNSDLLQFDMDNNGSITCTDFMVVQNSGETIIDNGIFMDRDASITVSDSLYWQQFNEGYLYIYLNQAAAGSADHAQLTCNSFTLEKDEGDFMAMRLYEDADATIAQDLRIIATNHEADDDVELRVTDDAAVDVNGSLIIRNTGGTTSDLRFYHFSTGDIDIANDLELESESQNIDIDFTNTGDVLVGDDVTMSLTNGNSITMLGSSDGDWIIADDWASTLVNASTFNVDLLDNASITTTDRVVVSLDQAGSIAQFDLDSNASFSCEDLLVNHQGLLTGTNGILLDRDASFSVNDSIVWSQTSQGNTLFYLNNSADGYAADAQLSASTFVVNKDSGEVLRWIARNDANLIVTGDLIVDAEEFTDGNHVEFITSDEAEVAIGGNLDIDYDRSATANTDIRFTLTSTGDFSVGGDLTADMVVGDDFDANFTGDGDVLIDGDFLVNLGVADIIDVTMSNDADLDVAGEMALSNGDTICRRILIDMDQTSSITVGEDLTIYNATEDDDNSETHIQLDRDAVLTVADSLILSHDGDDDVILQLNSANAGSADDAQLIASTLYIDFEDGDNVQIILSEHSDALISGDVQIDYGVPQGVNDGHVLRLNDDAIMDIEGSLTVNYENSNVGVTADFNLDLNNSSRMDVGPAAGPYTSDVLIWNFIDGDDCFGRIDGDALLNVYGDFNIIKSGGDNVDFRLNDGNGTNARLHIYGNWDIANTEDDDFILIDLNQSSLVEVEGDIDLTGIASEGLMEINMDGDSELELAGNFVLNAAPNHFSTLDMNANSTLEFDGGADQQIIPPSDGGGTDYFDYRNVIINNTSGSVPELVLAGDVTILDSMAFQVGIIESGSGDSILTFVNDAVCAGQSDASHVTGAVEKIGDDTFSFPVGNGIQHRPAAISAPSNTSHAIQVEYFDQNPRDIYGSTRDASLTTLSSEEFWLISQTNGTPSVEITLSWDTNSGGVGNLDSLRVAHFVGGLWSDEGNGGTSGNLVSGRVTSASAIGSFSPFTLASTNSINPLPVSLISFEAIALGEDKTLIEWSTLTEINNERFDVQRSANGIDYKTIGSVAGAGNSTHPRAYSYIDEQPLMGVNYYRLFQVDFNGEVDSSHVDWVVFKSSLTHASPIAFPNPTNDGHITLVVDRERHQGDYQVRVIDVLGRSIEHDLIEHQSGFELNLGNNPPGYYFIQFLSKNEEHSFKIHYLR